jgi:hypothetical protein
MGPPRLLGGPDALTDARHDRGPMVPRVVGTTVPRAVRA